MESTANHSNHQNYLNSSNDTPANVSTSSHKQAMTIPLPVYVTVMVMIDIVGVIGNSLVLFVILKKKRLQTYTNWMILNLALSDLAVTLFCIPLDIPLLMEGRWVYGELFCSLYYPLGSAQLFSSVFTLVNITYVRYHAICYPFKEQPSVFHAKMMIIIIRLFSIALVVPIMTVLRYNESSQTCYEDWDASSGVYYTIIVFLIGYAIPLIIIATGYSCIIAEIVTKKRDVNVSLRENHVIKENRKLVKLSVTVTVTFGVCVLPNQLVFILYTFGDLENYRHHLDLLLGSHMMLFLYCALNPIIYNVCSESFRKGLNSLFSTVTKRVSMRLTTSERATIDLVR